MPSLSQLTFKKKNKKLLEQDDFHQEAQAMRVEIAWYDHQNQFNPEWVSFDFCRYVSLFICNKRLFCLSSLIFTLMSLT
jgi:hypothetical protein